MALEEYKRKRDFKKTPEPPPEKLAARPGFSYLIQKHDATRLHYDLRLELDGVLLSWAVTKGPSLNPADKRLAVHVEDHPLSYGTFEGTIPKGEYGGGTVMLWDRGSWEPEFDPHFGMQKGHLAFLLHGERLKGAWDLVRMHGGRMQGDGKRDNWLLIKKKDGYAEDAPAAERFLEEANTSISTRRTMDEITVDAPPEVRASAARSSRAQAAAAKSPEAKSPKFGKGLAELMRRYDDVELATLVSAPPDGDDWLHEIKFDGYRLLAFLSEGDVCLRTRNGNDWTLKFPSIYASVSKLKAQNAVLDMEAVVLDRSGKSSFQALQRALGEEGNPQAIQAFVFDILHLDGKSLVDKSLTDRKATLRTLLKEPIQQKTKQSADKSEPKGTLHFSDHVVGHGTQMLEKACSLGLEGIVSKLAAARYEPGRQKSWLKSKCAQRQEFVIIGFTAARRGARAIGALHLGYYGAAPPAGAARRGAEHSSGLQGAEQSAVREHAQEKDAGAVRQGAQKRRSADHQDGQKQKLAYAGKVGTGFSMRDAQDLYDRLVKLEVDAPPVTDVPRSMLKAARWVKPELLCEVSFTEWTGDGHIRHPSFHGLREDKAPREVHMELPAPSRFVGRAASRSSGREPSHRDNEQAPSGAFAPDERANSLRKAKRSAGAAAAAERVHSERARPHRGRAASAISQSLERSKSAKADFAAGGSAATAPPEPRLSRRSLGEGGSRRSSRRSSAKASSLSEGGRTAAAPAASRAPQNAGALEVLGVGITHPDRVVFPDVGLSKGQSAVGLTKGQLAQYYAAVAKWILKDIAGHPLSVIRCPDGISGQCFFQRSPNTGLGSDIKPYRWHHKGKSYDYFYIEDEKGLIELVQMGAVELHPWGARAARIDYPDRLIFDLDPHESVPFDAVKLAAEDLRRRLADKGLKSFLKCTGGKGLHITAPLAEKNDWKEVKSFCAALAEDMVKDVPSAYVATMTKAKRTGKIFVDYFRNDYTATAIADFGVRARPGAPVAVPLEWSELRQLRAANQFTVADVLARLKRRPPDSARYTLHQRLPR